MRADQRLVSLGLAPSRTFAQRLIAAGRVRWGGAPVRKASEILTEGLAAEILPGEDGRYVSRGGLKLEHALTHFRVEAQGRRALDVGQSTGGFTDCLLQHGAARITGLDVGHGQLAASLREDPRVDCLEGVHARDVDAARLGAAFPAGGFGLVVIDVSFISLTQVLPAVSRLSAPGADLLALVKPQFEVGRAGLDHRGLVRDAALHEGVRERVCDALAACGWTLRGWTDSPITGGDGNHEFLLHAQRPPGDAVSRTRS
jgi:23S rRNA (cytidine1920-2'-O)/16S rRNA (cytidine1409-2'-O)-methyltransferase